MTLAMQLGRGYPLLVEADMDEHCWSLAKAIARNSIIVLASIEHVVNLHMIGSEYQHCTVTALP